MLTPRQMVRVSTELLWAIAASAAAAEPPPKPEPAALTARVASLVAKVGDESFEVREKATAELVALGPPAAPLVEPYLTDADQETAIRLKAVLRKIKRLVLPKDNPLKGAEAGDWVEYAVSRERLGGRFAQQTIRLTVTEKTDREAAVKVETRYQGGAVAHTQEVRIVLAEPLNPMRLLLSSNKGDMEEAERGEERITVGDKDYACRWVRYNLKGVAGAARTYTLYLNGEIPLTGVARMDQNYGTARPVKVMTEFVQSGHGE